MVNSLYVWFYNQENIVDGLDFIEEGRDEIENLQILLFSSHISKSWYIY